MPKAARNTIPSLPLQRSAFGETLRTLRLQQGLTQEQLAWNTGMERAYISELERGRKEPCLSTITKLAHAFNMTVAAFMACYDEAVTSR